MDGLGGFAPSWGGFVTPLVRVPPSVEVGLSVGAMGRGCGVIVSGFEVVLFKLSDAVSVKVVS